MEPSSEQSGSPGPKAKSPGHESAGPVGVGAKELADEYRPQSVIGRDEVYRGSKWNVVRETFSFGYQDNMTRDYIDHPGAVAVVVVNDAGEVLLQQQYRHPTGFWLWEIPAGLLDVPGESPLHAAQRELVEEADMTAEVWHTLVDTFTTPGGSDEAIRVFLARSPKPVVESKKHLREGEETRMQHRWVRLDEAVTAVLAGNIHNPSAVAGILATQVAAGQQWRTLRSAESAWEAHKNFR